MKALATTLIVTAASLVTLLVTPLLAAPPEADREAILSMAGAFEVNFEFEEDVALAPGYKIKSKHYEESALEVVVVAEDTPSRIILQHILVFTDPKDDTDKVIKHWAQVWTWQDTELLDYAGTDGIDEWQRLSLTEQEAAGKWTQLVTSVDDTPRYEGIGAWNHKAGISTWTATDTRRPLPRREYTKRNDYDYLLASNTHTIGANGWYHFQDNLKIRDRGRGQTALAHETGLNQYVRTDSPRAEIATNWWEKHHTTWNRIRDFWVAAGVSAEKSFAYTTSHDGTGLSKALGNLVAEKSGKSEIHRHSHPISHYRELKKQPQTNSQTNPKPTAIQQTDEKHTNYHYPGLRSSSPSHSGRCL